ncbi:hypothetical protein C5748_02035 [Phyllobacterium phragmitis]|uniref:SH3b domain-containing protein n=1 Tax=Phyllobacterium phragmitis TaxID=2670329 RepID=A0A2S9IZL1_9HYPH|nr:hypothetical protein [Phyllobacterium phragmitis]PRD45938.1 hypothetical protein C5748_02035 [Phyllobacterium phragmitis]
MARKRRSSKRSPASGITLLAILAMGAAGWWSTYEGKHSRTDFSRFFSQFSTQKEAGAKVSRPKETITNRAQAKAAPSQNDIPRPSAPVGSNPSSSRPSSSGNATTQVAAVKPPAPFSKAPLAKSGETKRAARNIPAGRASPDTTPSVIYARKRITIRKRAWDKAASVGTVEKGREMRSYGKTGKWHRVVVPSTAMIGWVHEDMLATSQPRSLITGSIFKTPIKPEISAPNPPPMPVKGK